MMFKTHMAFAVLFSLFFLYYFQPQNPALFSLVFLFAAILPDVDTNKSKIGQNTKPFSSIIGMVFGHRGFFHTIWIPLIVFLTFWYFDYKFLGIAFFFGYMLHLGCDIFTKEGIKLFHPLLNFHFKGFLRTGGLLEHIILLGVIISIGLFIIKII